MKRAPNGAGHVDRHGYKRVNGGTKKEHILIAEKALGKSLPADAVVHHHDENKLNNDPNNLVICPDRAYHALLHRRMRALDACGHADWRICHICKKYDDPENLYIHSSTIHHKSCKSEKDKIYAEHRKMRK